MAAKKKKKSKSAAGAAAAARGRGGRPPKGTPSKSEFIREQLAKGLGTQEIAAAAKSAGFGDVSPALIYKVKGRVAAKTGSAPKGAAAPRSVSKRVGGRKRGGGDGTASAFIRLHPEKKAGEIVALARAQGLDITPGLVYTTRGYDRRTSGKPKGRPGRKPGSATIAAAPRSAAGGSGHEVELKKLALSIGFPRAAQLIADLEKRWNALFG